MTEQLPPLTWEEEDTLRQNYSKIGKPKRKPTTRKPKRGSRRVRDKGIAQTYDNTYYAYFLHPVYGTNHYLGRFISKDYARMARDMAYKIEEEAEECGEVRSGKMIVSIVRHRMAGKFAPDRRTLRKTAESKSGWASYRSSKGASILLAEHILQAKPFELDLRSTRLKYVKESQYFRRGGHWYVKREGGCADRADTDAKCKAVKFHGDAYVQVMRDWKNPFKPGMSPPAPSMGFQEWLRFVASPPE